MADKSLESIPNVTVIIPMRNEEAYIGRCLDSVLANNYPPDKLQVLVLDGMSTDCSSQIVREYSECYPFICLLENPKRVQSAALNVGIREARGEIIIRMDAHTTYATDYVRQCVTALQTTGAENVGGVQRAVGTSYLSNAIAIATTSPFGAGNAHYRYSDREEWVDTVYLGAWHKRSLEALGGFNEEWVINEDYELNYRLRQMGGKILLSPNIRCEYQVRGSIKALARQYFRYGVWRVKTLVNHPQSVRWRQLVPPAFVVALMGSLLLLGVLRPLVLPTTYILMMYIIAVLAVSLHVARRRGWRYLPILPLIFAVVHLSWGMGFWVGLIRFAIPHIFQKSIVRAFRTSEPDF